MSIRVFSVFFSSFSLHPKRKSTHWNNHWIWVYRHKLITHTTYTVLMHTSTLIFCVYMYVLCECKMMINEANFYIISCEHGILWNSLTYHKHRLGNNSTRNPKKNVVNEEKQFDNCSYLWYGTVASRKDFNALLFVVFFLFNSRKEKENCLKQKKCKIISNGTECVFFFSSLLHTHNKSASAFPCASKQHVIIMPFGKVQMRTNNSKVGSHSIVWVWCVHLPSRTHAKYLVFFTQNWILIRRKQMVCLKFMTIYSAFSQL